MDRLAPHSPTPPQFPAINGLIESHPEGFNTKKHGQIYRKFRHLSKYGYSVRHSRHVSQVGFPLIMDRALNLARNIWISCWQRRQTSSSHTWNISTYSVKMQQEGRPDSMLSITNWLTAGICDLVKTSLSNRKNSRGKSYCQHSTRGSRVHSSVRYEYLTMGGKHARYRGI